jgi:hypothetical protein
MTIMREKRWLIGKTKSLVQRLGEGLWVPTIFTLLFLGLFSQELFSTQLFAIGDNITYYLPALLGDRSLWTNLIFSGYPIFADIQNMTWYPPAFLLQGLREHHPIALWNLFIVLPYSLAGSFTYGYVYTLTRSRLAAMLSGILFSMSGYMVGHAGIIGMVHTSAWMPLLIWALEMLRHRTTIQWRIIGGGAVACCFLGGHPQIALYGISLGMLYALFLGRSTAVGWRAYGYSSISVLFLGIGLSAIQLLPTIELSGLSARAELSFARFIDGSLHLWQGLQFFYPFLTLGAPSYIYVGIVLLPCVLLGIRYGHNRPVAKFWFWIFCGCLALIFIQDLHLGTLIYQIPLYNKFRNPNRHCFELAFANSVLAGFGVQWIQHQSQIGNKVRLKNICKLVLIMIIGLGLSYSGLVLVQQFPQLFPGSIDLKTLHLEPWSNRAIGYPILLMLIGLIVFVIWSRNPSAWLGQVMLLGIVLVDSGYFGWTYSRILEHFIPPQSQLRPTPTILHYQTALAQTHQRLFIDQGAGNWTTPNLIDGKPHFMPGAIFPNLNRLWQLPLANGYSPLILNRLSQMMQLDPIYGGIIPTALVNGVDQGMDLMAVKYRLSPFHNQPNPHHWRLIERLNNGAVYENLQAMGRSWLVPETVVMPPATILTTIHTGKLPDGRLYDPTQVALVEHPDGLLQAAPIAGEDRVQMQQIQATQITLQTQTQHPAFLVLSDVDYPGWQATIDGRGTKIFPTNYIQRGIRIPVGQHTINFKFQPLSFKIGALITLTSLIVVLFISGIAWCRK